MPALTKHRDLHGGKSLWQAHRVSLPPHRPLTSDRHCDVLIVGAGISGAMLADSLSAAGMQVIICDRRAPLQGSTAASTAMVLHEIDTPLSKLAKRMGRRDAERMWRRSFIAVNALRDRARQLAIPAHMEESESLYVQGNELDARGLQLEAAARAHAGFEVAYLSGSEVAREYGLPKRAALRSSGSFSADPRALAAGFLRAATAAGARLCAPEEVVAARSVRGGVRAQTQSGHVVRARHLVFATGYELPQSVPARGYRILSTWALATVQQRRPPWSRPTLMWEASDPYLYVRTTADGRVVCGGGDEEFSDAAARDALLQSKTAFLQRRLGALLPQVDNKVAYAWSGSFGSSAHGLPTIGEIPGMRRCYAVLGYGGNGITFSMMAAQMLRNVLSGEGDDDLDLVRFGRRG
ncbi:MAG: FAD-dependent oxidoreductase [Steroidobacteraceae bacterium]